MEYGDERILSSPLPTARTLRMRQFIPYQLWRFMWINMRVLGMVFKAHH